MVLFDWPEMCHLADVCRRVLTPYSFSRSRSTELDLILPPGEQPALSYSARTLLLRRYGLMNGISAKVAIRTKGSAKMGQAAGSTEGAPATAAHTYQSSVARIQNQKGSD